jgi:copper chaperone CopZ
MDGVADVQVDFDKKTADVTMEDGKSLSKEACDQAFAGTKYTVASFAEAK